MKTAFFLLLFAVGFMWHRGDFGASPQELVPPLIAQLLNPEPIAEEKPAPVDMEKLLWEASRPASVQELIVEDEKIKPKNLQEVFVTEKNPAVAQQIWLDSLKAKEERTELDKLRNFFAWGKYE